MLCSMANGCDGAAGCVWAGQMDVDVDVAPHVF